VAEGGGCGGEEEEHWPLHVGEGACPLQPVASAFAKVRSTCCRHAVRHAALQVARCEAGAALLCRDSVRDALVAMAHATDHDHTLQVEEERWRVTCGVQLTAACSPLAAAFPRWGGST
jgi:hypothetical protein